VIFITFFLAPVVAVQPAQARKFKVLHTFNGRDGDGPASQLVRDEAGNLYGTTIAGGSSNCTGGGCGTAFEMDKTGKPVWLHKFQGTNGNEPFPGLLRDGMGNLYRTTIFGGKTTALAGQSDAELFSSWTRMARKAFCTHSGPFHSIGNGNVDMGSGPFQCWGRSVMS
jgi:hypothetical protein